MCLKLSRAIVGPVWIGVLGLILPAWADGVRGRDTSSAWPAMSGGDGARAVINFSELATWEMLHPANATFPRAIRNEFDEGDRPPLPAPPAELVRFEEAHKGGAPAASAILAASPAPSASFQALVDDGNFFPPDTHGAAGPDHVMATLNSEYRIQNRAGAVASTMTQKSFWNSVLKAGTGPFDPRSTYDVLAQHFVVIALAMNFANFHDSALLIGVSQTSDPTGAWNLFRLDLDPAGNTWLDFPNLGFNKDWIVVATNRWKTAGPPRDGLLYVFKKDDLYNNVAATVTMLPVPFTTSPFEGFDLAPALTYDSTLDTEYLLQDWNGDSGGTGFLRLSSITGPVGSEKVNVGLGFPASAPWSGPPTNFAPQKDVPDRIATINNVSNVVYRNGSLWAVQTISLPEANPTRSSIQWWQLTTAGVTLQRGLIDDASGKYFYAFPSIAVNKKDDALIGYARFAADQYPAGNYAARSTGDPSSSLEAEGVLKAGEGPYVHYDFNSTPRDRWGDYSVTQVDPLDDTGFWTLQEYALAGNKWATWWGYFGSIPPPCLASANAGPDAEACEGTSFDLDGSGSGGSSCPAGFEYRWTDTGTGSVACDWSSNPICPPPGQPFLAQTKTYQLDVRCSTDATCTASDFKTFNILPQPVASAGPDTLACADASFALDAAGSSGACAGGFEYRWTDTDTATVVCDWSSIQGCAPPGQPFTPGVRNYQLDMRCSADPACAASDVKAVSIVPNPVASAGVDLIWCLGQAPLTLGGSPTGSGGTGAYQYAWSPPTGLQTPSDANPGFTAAAAGSFTYQVQVTDANGCSAGDSLQVTIHPALVADAGQGLQFCFGDPASVVLGGTPSAAGGEGTYAWNWSILSGATPAELSSLSDANPVYTPSAPNEPAGAVFRLDLVDGAACAASSTVTMVVTTPGSGAPPDLGNELRAVKTGAAFEDATFSWTTLDCNAASFNARRDSAGDFLNNSVVATGILSFTWTDVNAVPTAAGTQLYYRVSASNSLGVEGPY